MAILQLNSFHKLIKDIFIMVLFLLAIQLISRIFKVELIFLIKIFKILFLIYGFLDLAIIKYELKYNEYNDGPNFNGISYYHDFHSVINWVSLQISITSNISNI